MSNSQTRAPFGYRLTGLPAENAICVLGSEKALRDLSSMGKGTFLGIYDHPKGRYVKLTAERDAFLACEALQAPIFIGEEYKQLRAKAMSPDPALLRRWRIVCPPLSRPALKHQDDFCAFAFGRRGSFNASEQGTGKTATAVMLSAAWNSKRTLIVCPKSIMRQWENEFYDVLKSPPPVIILDDMPIAERIRMLSEWRDVKDAHVVVVNYEALDSLKDTLIKQWRPDCVVFDESWRLKNIKTKVTQAAVAIADNSAHVLLLTGTPIAQDVGDLWSQIRLLSDFRGEEMETHMEWLQRYAKLINIDTGNGFKKPKVIGCIDPVGLMRRMSDVFFRATKALCTDLPEKLKPEQKKLYFHKNVQALYDAVEKHGETVLDPLSLAGQGVTILRLQQITGGFVPAINVVEEGDQYAGFYSVVEMPKEVVGRYGWADELDSPKVEWCKKFAEEIMYGNPSMRVIFWCRFKNEVNRLVRELSNVLARPGAVIGICGSGPHAKTNKQLDDIKESFNSRSHDGVQAIVCTISKMAYGHNLQACDVNVIYAHTWSFVERDQLEDRSHRYGRVGPVSYIELVINNSVDEEILTATRNRQKLENRLAPDTTSGVDND